MARQISGTGFRSSDCGDAVTFRITVEGGLVAEVTADMRGCNNIAALTQAALTLARGRELALVRREVNATALSEVFGGLPAELMHAAELVSGALADAVDDAMRNVREPWRQGYGRR